MPDRVEVYDVQVAASVPVTNPTEITLPGTNNCTLRKVTIVIPDGHAGLTGIALGYGHQPILPRRTRTFISGNDVEIPFDLANYPPGPLWSAFVCNNDLIVHGWELRFEMDDLVTTLPGTPQQPIAIATINAAGHTPISA